MITIVTSDGHAVTVLHFKSLGHPGKWNKAGDIQQDTYRFTRIGVQVYC